MMVMLLLSDLYILILTIFGKIRLMVNSLGIDTHYTTQTSDGSSSRHKQDLENILEIKTSFIFCSSRGGQNSINLDLSLHIKFYFTYKLQYLSIYVIKKLVVW